MNKDTLKSLIPLVGVGVAALVVIVWGASASARRGRVSDLNGAARPGPVVLSDQRRLGLAAGPGDSTPPGRSQDGSVEGSSAPDQSLPTVSDSAVLPARDDEEPGEADPAPGFVSPQAVVDRLNRTMDAVNETLGTSYVVTLGETGLGGVAEGRGMVVVDFSLFAAVSEGALTALVAHEFAHELLGHNDTGALPGGAASLPAQAKRDREAAADEYAGFVLGRRGFSEAAFEELLEGARDTAWETPMDRTYYPHHQRLAAFTRGYQSGASARMADGVAGGEPVTSDETQDGDHREPSPDTGVP